LSRVVEQAAEEGDDVAADILIEAAQHLAGLTMAARMQVFTPQDQVRAAPIGGVFKCGRLYEEYRNRVERGGNTQVHPPMFGPAAGALLEAYRAAGLAVELKGAPVEK
jgi:N-acetylglucosamine kinase-like BadF-type ATPase